MILPIFVNRDSGRSAIPTYRCPACELEFSRIGDSLKHQDLCIIAKFKIKEFYEELRINRIFWNLQSKASQ